ncbi:hypothetical protein Tco_0158902 [Tanacetum coccineum]
MHKSFSSKTARLLYISNMQSSQILPISIKNPFSPIPSSAIEQAGSVFMNSTDHDTNFSIEDGKKFETQALIPRGVLSDERVTSSSGYQQQRRRRAASDSNLMGIQRRRFFWTGSGRVDGEKLWVARVGSKVLAYIG